MSEEPRPLMYEVGVEGDLFHTHRKNEGCAVAGCIPVTPPSDEARDAARWRWLAGHARRGLALWLFHLRCHPGETVDNAIDQAMGAAAPQESSR